jgi:kelch-like protein 2/3
VTVASDDGYKARLHKLILASASPYFYHLFEEVCESKHPVLILSGVSSDVLEMLISYMYCGFIDVPLEKLSELVSAGKSLRIKVCQIRCFISSTEFSFLNGFSNLLEKFLPC